MKSRTHSLSQAFACLALITACDPGNSEPEANAQSIESVDDDIDTLGIEATNVDEDGVPSTAQPGPDDLSASIGPQAATNTGVIGLTSLGIHRFKNKMYNSCLELRPQGSKWGAYWGACSTKDAEQQLIVLRTSYGNYEICRPDTIKVTNVEVCDEFDIDEFDLGSGYSFPYCVSSSQASAVIAKCLSRDPNDDDYTIAKDVQLAFENKNGDLVNNSYGTVHVQETLAPNYVRFNVLASSRSVTLVKGDSRLKMVKDTGKDDQFWSF